MQRKQTRTKVKGRVGLGWAGWWWLELGFKVTWSRQVTAESLLGVGRLSVCFLAADSDGLNSNEGGMWLCRVEH